MAKKISCIDDNLDIFSIDDEKLKILAKIISNKSSIEILNLLFHNEMTANEIAQKKNMSLQLVKYYLEKMQEIDLVQVTRTEKNSKARDMNYYKTSKLGIMITPSNVTEKAKKSKMLSRSIYSIYRFFGMMIASVAALSLVLVSAESSLLTPIRNLYSGFNLPIRIQGTGLADSMDESFYLAKTKVDSVVLNPGAGSGTPIFDPYSGIFGFTNVDFIVTMLIIAGIGAAMSVPLFLSSYRHSKRYPQLGNFQN